MLAISYEKLGEIYTNLGNIKQALAFFEKRSQLGEELYKTYPDNINFKEGLAWSYQFLGLTHSNLGNLRKILLFFEKMNNLFIELYETFPSNLKFKDGLALSYLYLGETQEKLLKDINRAKNYYLRGLKLYQELVKDFPQYPNFKHNLRCIENQLQNL